MDSLICSTPLTSADRTMATLATNVPITTARVVRTAREDARGLDALRAEAAREVGLLFDGVSGKRINMALVPGLTRHGISRAMNGCDGNPLYRLPSWFVLCRRVGVPKDRLQRVLDWLQRCLDRAYDDVPTPNLEDVLREEQERDAAEDVAEMRVATGGSAEDLRAWLDRLLDRHAYDRTVIAAVSRRLAVTE